MCVPGTEPVRWKDKVVSASPSITLLVITYKRAPFLKQLLEHVSRQVLAPHQVLVVDGSSDDESAAVAAEHPAVTYVRNPAGAGNMTSSRNAGLAHVTSDVVAFLDDDAYPRPDYVERLTEFCAARPEVLLGCCRAINGVPGEAERGRDAIGRFDARGSMSGNFGADPGRDLAIDHGLGATMWIRTSLLRTLGGFREYFPGTAAREDSDLFFRATQLGHEAWFVHCAVAEHVAAPQEGGERFDLRYMYWGAHNHAILLLAAFGLTPFFLRAVLFDLLQQLSYGGAWYRRAGRTAVVAVGWLVGVRSAWRLFGAGPVPAVGGYRRPS